MLGHGVIKPKMQGIPRLQFLRDALFDVLPRGRVVAAVEGYAIRALNRPYATGEWGGIARLALYESKAVALDVPPSSLKQYATHHGGAEKATMVARARHLYGYEGKNDNEADALHLAHLAADWWQRPALAAAQRTALSKTVTIYPMPFDKPLARVRTRCAKK